jgi:hypothetical protein
MAIKANWKSIVWREIHQCNDSDYSEHLRLSVDRNYFSKLGKLLNSWQPRPPAAEVEKALQQVCRANWSGKYIWGIRLRRLSQAKNDDISIEQLIAEIQSYHWLKRFIARHVLFHRGGEAVVALQTLSEDGDSETQQIVSWLLKSISAETTGRLGSEPEKWICPQCFTQCQAHHLLWKPILTYYGCRTCKRSWGLLNVPGEVVAVLDEGWSERYNQENNSLKVNWLVHRTVFDFDYINIIRATDEMVERFAMQVGNDTNLKRRNKYQEMRCQIHRECQLSKNTIRILENMFGLVVGQYSSAVQTK